MKTTLPRLAFKYRTGASKTLDRDLASLQSSHFYSASRETLNDPFEGRFGRSEFNKQFEFIDAILKSQPSRSPSSTDSFLGAVDDFLALVSQCGIFSLSYNPLNELIWAHYGGSHHGFCIGYDLEKLIEFEPPVHYCIDVIYENSAPSLNAKDLIGDSCPKRALQRLLGTKSTAWAYEEEVRVITIPNGQQEYDFRAIKPSTSAYIALRKLV
jgi:Protein of unknown function (DUF2971)